ncbi:MAG: hypothetical protein R2796_00690 [Chitinophagaceae bacterium]|nr:hypothetical protein [Chitinophagaceae bacterium]
MKKYLMTLTAVLWLCAAFAQNDKYTNAMLPKIALLDSNNSVDEWKSLSNAFERIADAEKTKWEPYYYASFCMVTAGSRAMPTDGSMGDNTKISDPYADKAEQLLDKASALSKDNSEIYCVSKMIHSLRMRGNPMARYMTEGAKASEALEKAKKLNPYNPRVYILEGEDKYYTPEQYGGDKDEAKKLFEKAKDLFSIDKAITPTEPQWGQGLVWYFLSQYK